MKNVFLLLAMIGLLSSCAKNELKTGEVSVDQPIDLSTAGKYKLIETLLDPGDGSGIFQPITSNKIIELHSNGTITSNGELCQTMMGNMPTSGTFSLADGTITTANCTGLTFEIVLGRLIIDYPCIEPCRAKLLKQ